MRGPNQGLLRSRSPMCAFVVEEFEMSDMIVGVF
jgi:hypothetical protein